MPRVQIRAYGGTGSLILRALYRVMMLDPISAIDSTQIELVHLDLDELSTDYRMIEQESTSYNELRAMKVKGYASANITLNTLNLKHLRDASILESAGIPVGSGASFTYSLHDLYGAADSDVMDVLESAFSRDDIDAPNRDGCYASLARNSFMANIMMQNGAFQSLNDNLSAGDIVIYVGSTDGGTANTFIEKDAATLRIQHPNVKCYSIRTLVYKKFPLAPHLTADQYQEKLDNLLMQTVGVLKRMETNKDALTYSDGGVVKSFYMTKNAWSTDPGAINNNDVNYLFDAIFLIGKGYMTSISDLSQTTEEYSEAGSAGSVGQKHSIHITELATAFIITSIINATDKVMDEWEQKGYIGNSGENATAITAQQEMKFNFSDYYINGQGMPATILTKWKKAVQLYTVMYYTIRQTLINLDKLDAKYRTSKEIKKAAQKNKTGNYLYRLFADKPGTIDSMDMIPQIVSFCEQLKGTVELLNDVSCQMSLAEFGIDKDVLANLCQNKGDFFYSSSALTVSDSSASNFNALVGNDHSIKTGLGLMGDPDKNGAVPRVKKLYKWSSDHAAKKERGRVPAVALIELFSELIG